MPRRQPRKCEPKVGGPSLDRSTELCLTYGHSFGVGELEDPRDWAIAWQRFGGAILRNYIKAFPGSRPAALYLLGELPSFGCHPKKILRHLVRIGDRSMDTSLHRRREELELLTERGIVSLDEARAGEARLATTHPERCEGWAPLSE